MATLHLLQWYFLYLTLFFNNRIIYYVNVGLRMADLKNFYWNDQLPQIIPG